MSWMAPTGGVAVGTVIVIYSPNSSSSANIGTTPGALDGLSSSGNQVFIGKVAFPNASDTSKPGSAYLSSNLLFGFDFKGTYGWDDDNTGANDSALPSALNLTGGNLAFAHADNGQYTGVRTGMSISEYKTSILNASNWTFEAAGTTVLSTTAFSITAVPEPHEYAILVGGASLRRSSSSAAVRPPAPDPLPFHPEPQTRPAKARAGLFFPNSLPSTNATHS